MRAFLPKTLIVFIISCLGNFSMAQITEIFNTPGPGTWTVPCGVNFITVGVYGAGGGGGGSNTNSIGGGGGGSGAYVGNTYFVVPGQVFSYDVGQGGQGSPTPSGNGSTGQLSVFNGNLFAPGGTGGRAASIGGANGTGGIVTIGWPPVTIDGNDGNPGTVVTGGKGGNHPGPLGGVGGPGGAPGAPGNPYGAGGGGGGRRDGSNTTVGSPGANGAIVITYNTTVTQPSAGPNVNTCNVVFLQGNAPDLGWTGTWSVVSGAPVIADVNDPNSQITIPVPGTCATVRWTFSAPGCPDLYDEVTICYPLICNDDPCGAIPLTVNNGSCSYTTFSNNGATHSTGMVEPGCGNYQGNDVWYSAVVPANGILTVNATDAAGGLSMGMGIALYDGPSCANVYHAGCDAALVSTDVAEITYMGTPGTTVYIRVWERDGEESNYQLCAFSHSNTYGDIIPGNNTITCGSPMTFMDPGGTGNYANNTGGTYILCPDTPGEYVTIDFSTGPNFFDIEDGYDKLTILDGNYDSSVIIGQWDGTTNPGVITSSAPDGCLTVLFQSDYAVNDLGWLATVSCSSTPGVNDTICSSTNCTGGCGVWICSEGLYPTTNDGGGIEDLSINTSGCFTSSGEIASQWFYFTALTTGTIEFSFNGPNGQDYNLAIWGPSTNGVPPCPMNTGDAPVLCSQALVGNSGGNPVGSSQVLGAGQSYEGPEGNGWVQQLNVVAGETYAMILNIYQNGNPQPVIDLTIGGTGELDCTPVFLPVELSSFDGINQGAHNRLNWVTRSELNNDYFTIERSINGFDWEVVGYVDGNGTSNRSRYYELVDYNPYFPITYYRLSQTDFDGKVTRHESVIAINNNKELEGDIVSTVFPNPTDTYATFTFLGKDTQTPLNVKVLNEIGSVVMEFDYEELYKGMPSTLRTDELSSGMYTIVFTQGDNQDVQKLSIIK